MRILHKNVDRAQSLISKWRVDCHEASLAWNDKKWEKFNKLCVEHMQRQLANNYQNLCELDAALTKVVNELNEIEQGWMA